MNYQDRETEFVIFCIENTAARLGVSGRTVYQELEKTDGINGFLYPSYQALHTQGKEYIVDETLQYLAEHNSALKR